MIGISGALRAGMRMNQKSARLVLSRALYVIAIDAPPG
jgi:hypothetical protein